MLVSVPLRGEVILNEKISALAVQEYAVSVPLRGEVILNTLVAGSTCVKVTGAVSVPLRGEVILNRFL